MYVKTQINLRLPPDLLAQIDERRETSNLTRNEWITRALQYALAAKGATVTETRRVTL